MERRVYERHDISLKATILVSGFRPKPCIIKDFSEGGLYVACKKSIVDGVLIDPLMLGPNYQIAKGDELNIQFAVNLKGNHQTFSLQVETVRAFSDSIGVRFTKAHANALKILHAIGKRQSKEKDSAATKPLSNQAIVECKKLSLEGIQKILEGSAEEFQTKLLESAQQATSNVEQSLYFEAITLIKAGKNDFEESYLADIDNEFQHAQAGTSTQRQPEGQSNESGLSLVEKDEFEDWLAITDMIRQGENEYEIPLVDMNQRLSQLFGRPIDNLSNPTAPYLICHIFHEKICKLELTPQALEVVYSAFREYAIPSLRNLYDTLATYLIKAGTSGQNPATASPTKSSKLVKPSTTKPEPEQTKVPDAKTDQSAGTSSENSQQNNSESQNSSPAISSKAAENITQDETKASTSLDAKPDPSAVISQNLEKTRQIYKSVVQLLNMKKSSPAVSRSSSNNQVTPSASPAPSSNLVDSDSLNIEESANLASNELPDNVIEFPQDKVMPLLNRLQRAQTVEEVTTNSASAGETVPSLRTRLEEAISEDSGDRKTVLSPEQDNAVEIVDRLMSAIAREPEVSTEATPLVEQLKVPLLKVMLQEPAFLEDNQHPAQKVVNHLARLSQKVNPEGGTPNKGLEKSLKKVVDTINNEYDENLSVFSDALVDLEKVSVRQEKAYERNIERITMTCEGQQKVDQARTTVETTLDEKFGGKRIPSVIPALLNAGWRDLLVLTALKEGTNSEHWLELIKTLDTLFEQLSHPETLAAFSRQSPEFLNQLNQELTAAPGEKYRRQEVITNIERLFKLDPATGKPFRTAPVELVEAHKEVDEEPISLELETWVRKVRKLHVGSNMELELQGNMRKYKLVWISENKERFVFVNHQGIKAADLKDTDLAEMLKTHKALILEGTELEPVEQGLYSIVQNVYNEMAHQATHDQLTKLVNRREFERLTKVALSDAQHNKTNHALIILDLDQFKIINNTCGHDAGDKLLRDIAGLLGEDLTEEDTVARLGGNEFGLLLANHSVRHGFDFAEKKRKAIGNYRFEWEGQPFSLTASIGLVGIDESSESITTLLKAADSTCYAAKEQGRNRTLIFESDDKTLARLDGMMGWVTRINKALEQDSLQMRCQRIEPIDSTSSLLPHYELLLCVVDEMGEQIPPNEFIEAAEYYNRMHSVDRWVIRSAFNWMQNNLDTLKLIGGFSINLSGHSLNDDSLLEFVEEELRRTKIPAAKICFEVTETAAITNINTAADLIREVKKLGCRFALDDFGSGLSSYAYLKHLPVDYLKIDGAFIKDILTSDDDYAMVKSINEIGHFMGKRTIAEYVENDDILKKLQEIGIDYAQGYGIEKPRLLDELKVA